MANYNYDIEYSANYEDRPLSGTSIPSTIPQARNVITDTEMSKEEIDEKNAMLERIKTIAEYDTSDDIEIPNNFFDSTIEDNNNIESSITVPVNIGEKCTIEFAKRLKIFDNNNYILNLTEDELEKINTYENENTLGKPFTICEVKDKVAYENCALATNNPYLSTVYDENINAYVCSLPRKMVLPKNEAYQFTYTSNSNIVKPESEIYFKNLKKNFCEERWHDWFCIPNYHLNNRWFNEVPSELGDTKSIGKCFTPCKFGYVPVEENVGKCILKKQFNGGAYKYDFDYTPIALVCLLGTTFNIFKTEYRKYLDKLKIDISKSLDRELLKNDKEDVIENIKRTLESDKNTIWVAMQSDIRQYINEIFVNIPDLNKNIINTNIVAPSPAIQNIMLSYVSEEAILHAYGIAQSIQNSMGDLEKYKSWVSEIQTTTGLPKDKLINVIRMLKKACNVCFDGKNEAFSKNYLLAAIKQQPIVIDENYEPYIDEVIVNNFNYLQKKERGYFDDYVNDFKSYKDATYTFLYFVAVVLAIFILYVIYIVFYKPINQVLNSILTFIVFLYFDIKYLFYKNLVNSYAVDDREYQKLTFIKKFYETFLDYDKYNYLR